jgi:hypothetical protein
LSKRPYKHNRRIAARRKPKETTKTICVAYEDGVGRNIGVALLDVSLFGAGLAVVEPLVVGSEVAIGLEVIGEPRRPVVAAKVVSCDPLADGGYRVGARFQQCLNTAFFQALFDLSGHNPLSLPNTLAGGRRGRSTGSADRPAFAPPAPGPGRNPE